MKVKEIKEFETEGLVEKIENAETALAKMKLNHQIILLENPSQIKAAHRDITRMKTEFSQGELNK